MGVVFTWLGKGQYFSDVCHEYSTLQLEFIILVPTLGHVGLGLVLLLLALGRQHFLAA
jgi:hypothetical protein